MQTVLLAPIHLDALYVKEGRRVSQPMADFTRLPYFDGKRDISASVAWLSEEIVAEPFQDEHFFLDKGIHLHWSFPQALTRAIYPGSGNEELPIFPPLPNRWLVTQGREINGQARIEKQWVVESDYLWPDDPDGKELFRHYVAYPNWEGHEPGSAYRPFRRLGRVLPLNDWMTRDRSQGEYLREPLTVVGYGEPGFAAFYPNCHSVFGFYDPRFAAKIPEGLYYQVIGWYGARQQDYLQILLERATAERKPDQTRRDLMELVLKEKLRWSVEGQAPTDAIIACHGRLTFRPEGDPLWQPQLESPMVTFGATVTEALSSYLAMEIADDLMPGASAEDRAKKKAEIEDQLEAALLAPQLDHLELDIAAKFREARHAKGFVAVDAGILWAVRPKTSAAQNADLPDWEEDILWPDVAALLADLNRLQKAYNEAWDDIQAARRQLFSDWYKYMLCAYPPENDEADYPKIAQVRFYIEHQALPALEKKIAVAGKLERPSNTPQSPLPMKASADSREYSLARRIELALAAALDAIARRQKTQPESQYALQPVAAPRFWRPAEPVVLMTGGMADGQEWREREEPRDKDGLLRCQMITIGRDTLGEVADRICQDLERIGRPPGRTWTRQPWRPFLLHWEVELTPFKHLSNLDKKSRDYDPQFVTRNFTLKRSDSDLSPTSAVPALAQGAHVYTGSSMLTPHVVDPYVTRLKDYLDLADKEAKAGKSDRSPLNKDTRDRLDRALKKLTSKDFFCLAQTLSGFNDALLMRKQTLQLPIADPIGFADSRQLAARVEKAVDHQVFSAPLTFDDFSPIRTGELRIKRTRLIGEFGRIKDFECCACCSATPMPTRLCDGRAAILLPPRITQPARLHFRFLAAEQDGREMNSHPGSAPICGWAMANHLDQSLFFYDAKGEALGSLETDESARVRWRSAPGRPEPIIQLDQIGNAYLRRMVAFFLNGSKVYFLGFLTDLENSQMKIEPELAGDAFLISQPLALVRATLSLELQGPPAAHQGWNAFRQNMTRRRLEDDKFTRVQFPFRLGEQDQLNDGLTVYWLEDENGGYQDNAYIIPNYDKAASPEDKKCDFLYQSVEAPPLYVTMLIDPRALVHTTIGVLPTKGIQIPPYQYADALKRIEMSFLAAPLLVDRRRPDSPREIALPIADPPGYHWSWLEKHGKDWTAMPINAGGLYTPFTAAVEAREGWLKLTRNPEPKKNTQGDGRE
jgi:hypothetical protein